MRRSALMLDSRARTYTRFAPMLQRHFSRRTIVRKLFPEKVRICRRGALRLVHFEEAAWRCTASVAAAMQQATGLQAGRDELGAKPRAAIRNARPQKRPYHATARKWLAYLSLCKLQHCQLGTLRAAQLQIGVAWVATSSFSQLLRRDNQGSVDAIDALDRLLARAPLRHRR